jgi:DNA-binding SARP family transcriptional activator/tetratricopeptide (TPR) repeat protein
VAPLVTARVLGGFEVTVGGRPVPHGAWQRLAAERLVKLVLVTRGHALSREAAAGVLWPDASPDASRANLRKAVFYARRALEPADLLLVDARTIAVDPSQIDLDLDRLDHAMDALVADGDPGAPNPALEAATRVALELGAGELLPDDAYEDWLAGPRERLMGRWQAIALEVARRAHAAGCSAAAHELVARLLEQDPADEAAHRLAIEQYGADGRRHAARRQYELCRLTLREILDVEPSAETEAALLRAAGTHTGTGGVLPVPAIVGRQAEIQRIEPLLDRVADGRLACLVVSGPTGIGKTRLLQEVVAYARASSWQVIEWQAVEATRSLAYGPFRVGLAGAIGPADLASFGEPAASAFATLLPSLGVPPGVTFAGRAALVSATALAVERLAQARPVVLAIDDVPLLDAQSSEVLQTIVAGLSNAPILVAATRRDDVPADGPTDELLTATRRPGGLEVPLGPLAPRDIEPLVLAHLGGERVDPRLASRVFEMGGGSPLFCLELVRAALGHGRMRLQDGRWTGDAAALAAEVPESARKIVAARMADLPEPARDLLAIVGELGPEVPFEMLTAVMADRRADLVGALDAALGSGLLVERASGYAIAHPTFRVVVRDTVRLPRRGEIHLAAARVMAGAGAADTPEVLADLAAASPYPSRVAAHALTACELGRPEATELAVAFGFAAGEHARALFDHETAATLLERALVAWHRLPADRAARFRASGAYAMLAAAHTDAGDDVAATTACRSAIATAQSPDEIVAAYQSLRYIPYRHGDFESVLAILSEAMSLLEDADAVPRARVLAEIGWACTRLNRLPEALEALEEAAPILEAASDADAMKVLDQLGTVLRFAGLVDDSIHYLERSLALALSLHDSHGELHARIHLVGSLTRAGMPARARPHAEQAMELARMTGDRYLASVAAWKAAEMEDALGNGLAAMRLRRQELHLLDAIGGNPHNAALAHAHLAVLARKAGRGSVAAREARAARRHAARSEELGYDRRIEQALATADWRDLVT